MATLLDRLLALFAVAPPPPLAAPENPIVQEGTSIAGFQAHLDSAFVNTLSGLGTMADKGSTGRVDMTRRRLAESEADALCAADGIAEKIVTKMATDATRAGWIMQDPTDDVSTMADEDLRLQIPMKVREALICARKYGNGYTMMICAERIPPGYSWASWQAQPLRPDLVYRVLNLINLDSLQCTGRDWDGTESSDNYGLPLTYTVSSSVAMSELAGLTVHHSRLIRWRGVDLMPRERMQNGGRDRSVLQPCLDALRNVDTVSKSGANYVQEMGVAVFTSPLLAAKTAGPKAALYQAMMKMMAWSKSAVNMIMLEPNETIERSSPSISGFGDLDDNSRAILCAVSDYPMTILFGSEPGGLTTEDKSSRINWYTTVDGYQITHLAPGLYKLYRVIYAQQIGPTQGRIPKSTTVVFNPLEALSEETQATIRKTTAETDKLLIECGVFTAADVQKSRYSKRGWQLNMLPVEPVVIPADVATPANQTPAPVVAVVDGAGAPVLAAANLPLTVEVPTGDIRRGISPKGEAWSTIMPADYGSIKGTRGLDGEEVDYLLVRNGPRGTAFVVEQLLPADAASDTPEAGSTLVEKEESPEHMDAMVLAYRFDAADIIDEYKVILGCSDIATAKGLLDQVYGKAGHFGLIFEVPESGLLDWLSVRSQRSASLALSGIDFAAPVAVREEIKQGLAWLAAGKGSIPTGSTMAWARRLAAGQPISPRRIRQMRGYLAARATDRASFTEVDTTGPSARRITWALWGGDPAVSWIDTLSRQVDGAYRI